MSTEYPLLDLQSIPSLVSSEDRVTFFANITPEIAKEVLEKANYEFQRPESKAKKMQLVSAMKDGSFEPVATLVFCVENGISDLVNGQHTLSAMEAVNKSYTLPIQVYAQKPSKLYAKIDRGKSRSLTDAIRTSGIANSMSMSETSTAQVARGVKMILEGYIVKSHGRILVSEDVILSTMAEKYKKQATRFFEMINHLEYAKKLTGQVPMSLFLTLYTEFADEKTLNKVDEFAYGCASNIGLKKGDPRRLVYVMYAERARWGGNVNRARMTRKEETATLLGCWDCWYNDTSRLIRYRAKELDGIIAKSPNVAGTNISYQTSTRD